MSPERTNNVTSLPVRPDRSQRADQQQAPASDFFATLLDAHADRTADRAPSRRERQPSDDHPRDRRPVDRPARPADVRDRSKPAPAADKPASEPAPTDEATPADKAAAAAAASAMLGLLAAVTPQQQQPTAPAATAAVEPQAAPAAQPVAAVIPQGVPSAPAAELTAVEPQVAPSGPVKEPAKVPGPETTGIEGSRTDAPAHDEASSVVEVATEAAASTPVAGRASVAESGNTRPGDRRSEGVSGGGAEARPSAQAPVNAPATTTQSGDSGSQQSDQRQNDAPRTMQPAAPAPAPAPTQRVDVTPLAPAHAAPLSGEPKGAATLAQAPRAVGQLIHLASEQGVQHARLNLKPVELGGIEIRLIASSAGVTAHVVADSPEAARLLQQAGDDLRRSLADNNVELLSLDVSTSDQERRDASAAGGGFEQFGDTGPRGRDGLGGSQHARAGATEIDLPMNSPNQGAVIELPDGVLVDVLA